jgi:hypothetical protein
MLQSDALKTSTNQKITEEQEANKMQTKTTCNHCPELKCDIRETCPDNAGEKKK